MRVVVDTNVVVSALLFGASVPGSAFVRVLDRGTILTSRSFVRELDDVLRRAKFDQYLSREDRDRFLEALIRESELVDISETVKACRDPEDDRILELAVNGSADFVITGDADLLAMDPFRGTRIVTPADFLHQNERLRKLPAVRLKGLR